MTDDPLGAVERFARNPDDAEAARMVAAGVAVWLRARGAIRLERALGLPASAGGLRRARRDRHLQIAAAMVVDCPATLHAAVRRFGGFQWPRWRHLADPPAHATVIEQALFRAFASGAPMPTTRRQIANILKR